MFCPTCKYEYQAGTLICPDCNTALVEESPSVLPAAAVAPDGSWVAMGTVTSQMSSELAKGCLDSNNIPSVIMSSGFNAHSSGLRSMFGHSVSDSAGNIIMVPKEYRNEAAIILEAVLGDDLIQPEN